MASFLISTTFLPVSSMDFDRKCLKSIGISSLCSRNGGMLILADRMR